MDVLAQASSVVERAEAGSGRVTLTLDLDDASQRAAYAAALAVLQIHGVDPLTLTQIGAGAPAGDVDVAPPPRAAQVDAAGDAEADAGAPGADTNDASIRRSYAEALGELAPDATRKDQVLKDTFPRVRELLRDGANVEAVAQIQYRRWNEEHLDTLRN
jgi:hypothetical protein